MRQAIHIFAKDVRYLWREICAVAVTQAALTYAGTSGASGNADNFATLLLTLMLPVAWWYFIARLIHAEPLAGRRQFWVTRPYNWKSLLGAKALAIALFVNLPKLVSDAVVVRAYGFELSQEAFGILWTQALLIAVFLAPVAALAALTAGFTQMALTTMLLALAVAACALVVPHVAGPAMSWFGMEWIRGYSATLVLAVAAVAIVVWQYKRRSTGVPRLMGACAAGFALIAAECFPFPIAFAAQSRITGHAPGPSAVKIEFDPELKWATRALVDDSDVVDVNIALRVSGVPEGLTSNIERLTATFEGAGGASWQGVCRPAARELANGALTAFHARVSSSFYRRVKDQPMRIHGSAYLTLYGNPRRTMVPSRDKPVLQPVAGVGLCAVTRTRVGLNVDCRSAFRARADIVTLRPVWTGPSREPHMLSVLSYSGPAPLSYWPFDAFPRLMPVDQSFRLVAFARTTEHPTALMIDAIEPVAHVSRDLEITGFRLADYEKRLAPPPMGLVTDLK
jgi:hypothetical protein